VKIAWVVLPLAGVIALVSARGEAAERFVDGACRASGTGASPACGPAGPFRTIQEGIDTMQPGDTVTVRGGVYEERVVIASECAADAPCVLRAAPGERPIVRGMRRRDEWRPAGVPGVWLHDMEATPDELTNQQPDAFHPMTLYQDTGGPTFVPLGYDGDGVTALRDGHYSYHRATRVLAVDPLGSADPTTAVYVPHVTTVMVLTRPASYVTVRGFAIEGARGVLVQAVNTGWPLAGIAIEDNLLRYFPRFGIHVNAAPGIVIRDNVIEYGGRGLGGYVGGSYGAYGMRLFQVHGALVQGNTVAHLGAGGNCTWCDPPWGDSDHSVLDEPVYANGIDFKQSIGGQILDNRLVDLADRGIGLDVSRDVMVARNVVERVRMALSSRTQTPENVFTGCADNVFADNVVDRCEIGVRVEDDGLLDGASFLARIERSAITRTLTPYEVPDRPYVVVVGGNVPTTLPATSTSTTPSSSTTSTSRRPTTTRPTSTLATTSTRPTSTSVTSTTATPASTTSTSLRGGVTSTAAAGSTTSTTLPPASQGLSGRSLIVRQRSEVPDGRRFRLLSRDREQLTLGEPSQVAALIAQGGVLRTRATKGNGFSASYRLHADKWALLSPRHPEKGLVYRDPSGPIALVRFESRRRLLVIGAGPLLHQDLEADPAVIEVDLQLGTRRYCVAFGGKRQIFESKRRIVRASASRPRACRPPVTPDHDAP